MFYHDVHHFYHFLFAKIWLRNSLVPPACIKILRVCSLRCTPRIPDQDSELHARQPGRAILIHGKWQTPSSTENGRYALQTENVKTASSTEKLLKTKKHLSQRLLHRKREMKSPCHSNIRGKKQNKYTGNKNNPVLKLLEKSFLDDFTVKLFLEKYSELVSNNRPNVHSTIP